METFFVVLWFLIGMAIIIKGGDWFVEAAIYLAKITGIPNVVIGATIVSIATTLPELMVSTMATYQELYDVAIGNVVGSLICNTGLILGISAMITPLKIKRSSILTKGILMMTSCSVVTFFLWDKIITKEEGNVLLIFFLVYILLNVVEFKNRERGHSQESQALYHDSPKGLYVAFQFIMGTVFIILGAQLLVKNGVALAAIMGVPEQIVSLTMIALGTSLPELITAISAIVKKQQGISIGNIIGANVLNLLMVLGVTSKMSNPGLIISYHNVMLGADIYHIPQTLYFDLPVALLLMGVLTLGGAVRGKISRGVGMGLLCIYGMYLFILAKLFM